MNNQKVDYMFKINRKQMAIFNHWIFCTGILKNKLKNQTLIGWIAIGHIFDKDSGYTVYI